MKLQDLDNLTTQARAKKILETRLAQRARVEDLTFEAAQKLLSRVRNLLAEHRSKPSFHTSERNPGYLKLLMLEQGLDAHLSEQNDNVIMMPVDTKDPKVQQTLKKAQSGQTLRPEEQKLVTAMASQKQESKKKLKKRIVKESDLQQAQVVLAAQDLVDRMQSMIEDISEMQFKDLPALADSIKNDIGQELSTQFQSSVSAALTQLLSAVQESKAQVEGAQGVLSGNSPTVPGSAAVTTQDIENTVSDNNASSTDDLSPDELLPRDAEDAEIPSASLGRDRR